MIRKRHIQKDSNSKNRCGKKAKFDLSQISVDKSLQNTGT